MDTNLYSCFFLKSFKFVKKKKKKKKRNIASPQNYSKKL